MSLMDAAWDDKENKRKVPPLLSWEEVGQLLKKAMFLKSWVENLEKISLERIVSGGTVPGWKIIEGRSSRALQDPDAVLQELKKAGYEEGAL